MTYAKSVIKKVQQWFYWILIEDISSFDAPLNFKGQIPKQIAFGVDDRDEGAFLVYV